MICRSCKEDKLSKEFPFDPLTEQCDHPLLHCLDCVIASVKNSNRCSQCKIIVREDNEKYLEYQETLDFLFPNVDEEDDTETSGASFSAFGVNLGDLVVTTLAGESAKITYSPYKKILDVKKEIDSNLKIPPNKQRLLYQKTELKTKNKDHQFSTLKEYNVPPNSTLHLIILLCAVPDDLEHAVFDFSWGYPHGSSRRDYLDVSVFIYSGSRFVDVVYYRNRESYACPGVRHSGPADMSDYQRVGRHKVNVFLKLIPDNIDNLFFTLSAWGSSNISKYPNPTLRFYDVNSPNKQLCNDSLRSAAHCRSIIMCSLSKKDGQWFTQSLQVGSDGFTRNFWPIKSKISDIIF